MEMFTAKNSCFQSQKSAPGFKKANDVLLPLFTLLSHFYYANSRLSGQFTQVPTSPDDRGPSCVEISEGHPHDVISVIRLYSLSVLYISLKGLCHTISYNYFQEAKRCFQIN